MVAERREARAVSDRAAPGDVAADSYAGEDAREAAATTGDDVKGAGGAPGPASSGTAEGGQIGQPVKAPDFNVWQFAFMAVGALLAYEFGRGTGRAAEEGGAERPAEPVVMTDPSN